MTYDYVIVGAGLFGATFARMVKDTGGTCIVLDSRDHVGGNCYSKNVDGIDVHMYGPHIFHTNDDRIWKFVNRFATFYNYIHSLKVFRHGRMFSLPFNMHTFNEIWPKCITPSDAMEILETQRFKGTPKNLEEQALKLIGEDIYNLIVKDYTQKQWQRDPRDLPPFIIKRIPVRFTYDNNYFDDKFQGIPIEGYDKMVGRMLYGIDVFLNTNYFDNRAHWDSIAKKIVFTGKIDEFFDYEFGELDYRSLHFIHDRYEVENYQGAAVVNYPDPKVPWTRLIEHKHFMKSTPKTNFTIVTKEIPIAYTRTETPYYPINDPKNNDIYKKYLDKAETKTNVIFGGRLAEYKYYDMHQAIGSAISKANKEFYG